MENGLKLSMSEGTIFIGNMVEKVNITLAERGENYPEILFK